MKLINGEPVIESFRDALDVTADYLVGVLLSKRADYGPHNILKFGEMGILVRASDKLERLANLLQSGKDPANESTEDTWLDVAGYAVLALVLRRIGPEAFRDLPVVQDDGAADYAAYVESGSGYVSGGLTRTGVALQPAPQVTVTTGPQTGVRLPGHPVRGTDYEIPWANDEIRNGQVALSVAEYRVLIGTHTTIKPVDRFILQNAYEREGMDVRRDLVFGSMVQDLYRALLSYGLWVETVTAPVHHPLWRADIDFAKSIGLIVDLDGGPPDDDA